MARKGECVTCENGHYICTMAMDVQMGDVVRPNQFDYWAWDHNPQAGRSIPLCYFCDRPFLKPLGLGAFSLHVADEWRSQGRHTEQRI